jgi:hypothetical protein
MRASAMKLTDRAIGGLCRLHSLPRRLKSLS